MLSDDERIEGPHCYGSSSEPHTPVRTLFAEDAYAFSCPLCKRSIDVDEALADMDDDEIDLWRVGRAAGVVRSGAAQRVDLYGMNEMEVDAYLSTHYSEVVAHDAFRVEVLTEMIERGFAKEIGGDYVKISDGMLATMRENAKRAERRFFKREMPEIFRFLLDESEDAGKVRLSVLASVPRTLAARNYEGRATGTVEWDEEGKARISFSPQADAGTFISSMALFFRRMLSPAQRRAAERAFGIRGGIWRPEDEERYARAYLRWVSEGNAPVPELREAFEVFNVIATPEMLDVKLTDEMRAVFRSTLDYTR
jgi:hypothetical protein